jgi:hypothetical protein
MNNLTCESCCNFIICGIKPVPDALKCSAFLNLGEVKEYFWRLGIRNPKREFLNKNNKSVKNPIKNKITE